MSNPAKFPAKFPRELLQDAKERFDPALHFQKMIPEPPGLRRECSCVRCQAAAQGKLYSQGKSYR